MAAGATIDDEDTPPQAGGTGGGIDQPNAADQVVAADTKMPPSASVPPTTMPQGQLPSIDASDGKGQIQTVDHSALKFDQDKLKTVNNTLDLLNAMQPKSRNQYMKAWETQYGAINDHFDNLQKQLGARPPNAEDTPLSKKEKFAALLEFGLHMMKASATPTPNQGAVMTGALGDSINGMQQQHKATAALAQGTYDNKQQAINQGRQSELGKIGTLPNAVSQQSSIDKGEAAAAGDNARSFGEIERAIEPDKPSADPITYGQDDKGNQYAIHMVNGHPKAEPVTGIDGKPFNGRVLGKSTGSGVPKGDTAQMRNYGFLVSKGVDSDEAYKTVFKPKTGDPQADHLSTYKSIMGFTGDPKAAQQGADQYVKDNYSPAEIAKMRQPQGPPAASSNYKLDDLKPGMVRGPMPDGTWWTRNAQGELKRVQVPPGSTIDGRSQPPQTHGIQ